MVLHTLFSFIMPLMVLFAGGATALLWLLPRKYLSYGFYLSPVVGLTVFASLGLFNIGVLLVPLSPLDISLLIGLAFAVTAWFRRERFVTILAGIKVHGIFILMPLMLLLVIAIGSRDYGLSFLSASQDEIQYVNNALQILQHQHTGDALDIIVPRVDHWARDGATIHLSYNQTYRRGAEIFLAGVMALTGENPFISFTVAGVVAFFCFILALPAICRAFLGISPLYSALAQLVFGASHLWIMLILQGSLANLCSLSLFCLAAVAVPQLNESRRLGASMLAGLLLSGPVIFYNEVAMAVLLAPLGLILVIGGIKRRVSLKTFLHNVPVIILALIVFSHIALFGLMWMTSVLLLKTLANSSVVAPFSMSSAAGVLGPIYGIYTYYSLSSVNSWIAQHAASMPWAIVGFVALLYVAAIWGLFKRKTPGSYVLGTALIVLLIVTLHSLIVNQPFMLVRSQQYSFSYIIIGLILTMCLSSHWWIKSSMMAIVLCLMGINVSTILSTLQHLYEYDDRSDPIIMRYSPRSALWGGLLKLVDRRETSPVLITGYDSTAKPLLIASLLEPRPNYMGMHIRNFWGVMSPPPKLNEKSTRYGIYGAHDGILTSVFYEQLPDLQKGIETMDALSQVAIIMVGSGDPDEWREKRLISRQRKRFFPIGDIVERHQWSPLQLKVDGLLVASEYSENKHINESLNVQVDSASNTTAREVEFVFESVINADDIAQSQDFKDKIQISVKEKVLLCKLLDANVQSVSLKVLRKGGVELKQLRLVDVY